MSHVHPDALTHAWSDLQALAPVRVLRTEHDYDAALHLLQELLTLVDENEHHPLYELLDTLGTLIHAYEEQQPGFPLSSGGAVLHFLMEEHAITPADLPEIGDAATIQALLTGAVPISAVQRTILAQRFGVRAETFAP